MKPGAGHHHHHVVSAVPLCIVRQDILSLGALLLASLLLWILAYQVPFSLRLPIGGDTESHRREDDASFLRGFNASQPASDEEWRWWTLEPGYGYRWTEDEASIHMPGVGGGTWIVTLFVSSGGRPQHPPITSTWQVGNQSLHPLVIPPQARTYRVLASADARGDLTIYMNTPPYTPPDDPRTLGLVLREVQVNPAASGPRMPALPHLAWLAAALALVYALARWLVLALRPALLAGLACAAVLALLLAWQRMALTLFSPTLAGLTLVCGVLALLARRLLPGQQSGPIIALALLAFALRAGGMLHPHAIFSDHLLHANNLLQVGLGDVYFTEGLPTSRGGGDAPYPPGLYLLLAPVLTLAPTDMHSRALVVQSGVALLDSMVLVLLWLLLRQAGLGQRAALSGAALYLLPPPIMASFSIGEYANLGGQILALPVLALLALGHNTRTGRHKPGTSRSLVRSPFSVLLCLGLLSHLGVAISLVLVLLAAWLLSVGSWLSSKARSSGMHADTLAFSPAALTIGGVLAAAFAIIFYYSAPEFIALYAERFASDAPTPPTQQAPFLATAGSLLLDLFTPGSRLLPLTVAAGLVGVLLLWQRGSRQHTAHSFASLRLTLLAWWVGSMLSLGLLLVAQQGVRWQHFLYPALCLSGAVALAAFGRRGRAGHVVSLIAVLAILSHGLIMWVWQMYDYLH